MSYIYVLSNTAMPGLVKIGRTTNSPDARAKELFTTGVPCRFRVEHAWPVPEHQLDAFEKQLHNALDEYRFNQRREFFAIEPDDAINVIDQYVGHYSKGLFDGNKDKALMATSVVSLVCAFIIFLASRT